MEGLILVAAGAFLLHLVVRLIAGRGEKSGTQQATFELLRPALLAMALNPEGKVYWSEFRSRGLSRDPRGRVVIGVGHDEGVAKGFAIDLDEDGQVIDYALGRPAMHKSLAAEARIAGVTLVEAFRTRYGD